MSSQKPLLKNAITQILSCALQPHSDIQRLTEERKKALEMTEDYPFILLEIIQSKEEAYAEKVMAATFLKNYIIDDNGAINSDLKFKLSTELLDLLSQENDVIRQMMSSALETLVVREYPNLFTVINSKIMSFLLSDDVLQTKGAIQFMRGLSFNHAEFCSQNMYFPSEYIEPLLNVLHNESYPMELRASTVSCMVQILINSRKNLVFAATKGRLTEVFDKLLSEPYSPVNDFQLISEIIIQISYAVTSLENEVLELITRCLPAIGQIMFNCCVEYKQIIMGHKQTPRDSYETEPQNFNTLIFNILILINNIFMIPSYSFLLTDCLNDFMYLLLILMCVSENVNDHLFIEEELDTRPEVDYTIRGRCSHTLLVFMDSCNFNKFSSSFHHVLQKHITEANLTRNTSELYYHKILETLMYAVGLLSYVFNEPRQEFCHYVEHWSSSLHDTQVSNLVLSRLLWLGGKYSTSLTAITLSNHLNAILRNYSSQNNSLRTACYVALHSHLSNLKDNPHRVLLSSLLRDLTECLFSIPIYSTNICILCMESMAYFFEAFPEATSQRVFQMIVDCVLAHIGNTNVIRKVKFLLSKVASISSCKEIVQTTFIPFCLKLIYKNCPAPLNQRADITERGFDLLNTVIKFYPETIDDDVVLQGFLAASNCIMDFQDSSTVEVASIFVTNLLMKSPYQIKTSHDNKGKVLAEYVPDLLFKLLEPHPEPAVCPSKFGRLCVISLMTLDEHIIQQYIESILKALLSALQRTNFQDPIKSYCFILAYMCTWQTESIINFLSGIPGPDGRSALSYFLNKWEISMVRSEKFETSIITLAICKMIEYSLTKNDDRINDCRIMVEGPQADECSGLEKLYLLLIKIFFNELEDSEKCYGEEEEEPNYGDILIKNHPIYNLNLQEHIKSFLRTYDTHHYYNVVKKYIINYVELEKHGIKPNNL